MKNPTRKEILAAFRSSKAHWLRLATGRRKTDEGIQGKDCAFCHLFPAECGRLKCPLETAREGCCDGLYRKARYILLDGAPASCDAVLDSPQFRLAAKAVYDFIALKERDFIKRGGRHDKRGSGNP